MAKYILTREQFLRVMAAVNNGILEGYSEYSKGQNIKQLTVEWSDVQDWDEYEDMENIDSRGVYIATGKDNHGNVRYYIGMTSKSFLERFNDHEAEHKEREDEFLETIVSERKIYLGQIRVQKGVVTSKLIHDVEVAFIHDFVRKYPKALVNDIKYKEHTWNRQLKIENEGQPGFVSKEIVTPNKIDYQKLRNQAKGRING